MDLVLPLAVGVGIYLLAKGGSFGSSNTNFTVRNVSLTTSGITPVLRINIQTYNFSGSPIHIQGINANVFINGDFYGNVTTFGQSTVNPNTAGEYPIELRMSYGQIYDNLRAMWDGSAAAQIVIDVEGKIIVDGSDYALNLQHRVV